MSGLILAALLMAPPVLPTEIPLSVWSQPSGTAQHLQSGLTCPQAFGAFRLARLTAYDKFGFDVSCQWVSGASRITVYMTRASNLTSAYVGAKASLMQVAQAENPVLVSDATVSQGGLSWLRAEYTIDGGGRSDIWMTDLRGWLLLYRTTYQVADAPLIAKSLDDMTKLVRDTAGQHLDLCAKTAAPPRPGKLAQNEKANDVMGALLGGITAAAGGDKDAPAEPIFYCVEDRLPGKDRSFLSWRGVTAEGVDARVDRLTPVTMDPPLALDTAYDDGISAILGELGGGKPVERWVARVQQGTRTIIFGYYDKRPSATLLAPLMTRILDGTAESLGSYDADGKTINVQIPPQK